MLIIKKKFISIVLSVCLCIPCFQIVGLFYSPLVAYAATTSDISFSYKKGYSVDGRIDYRFHRLSKGRPTVKLTTLNGASSSNQVKLKLYKGDTYYGVVSFSSAGTKQYSTSVEKGQYYLKVSGGCGDRNGWVQGKGTITPVYS